MSVVALIRDGALLEDVLELEEEHVALSVFVNQPIVDLAQVVLVAEVGDLPLPLGRQVFEEGIVVFRPLQRLPLVRGELDYFREAIVEHGSHNINRLLLFLALVKLSNHVCEDAQYSRQVQALVAKLASFHEESSLAGQLVAVE
jgi:hypothetical protein